MAASVLGVVAPATVATASGSTTPTTTSTTSSTPAPAPAPTAAQLAAKKKAADAKKRAAIAKKKAAEKKKRAAVAKKKRILKKKRAAIAKKKRILKKKRAAAARGKKIVRQASKYKGTPYVWGGTSPRGFDCSGYVQYVVKKSIKKKLPRVAGAQMKKGKSVSKGSKKKGDLIGFYSGSGYYHIAIYAGDGKVWHAPRPGKSVKKEKLWTSKYKVRRL
ncbi:C40 family peptidase [Aeromicrobium duanguangcaii]|uniref:C40 family peptidase n=1 Tax=Aeromicrobium duanguangcaii TaxID=2968086 RepID=UPI002016A9F6|nr:C40 family peptidase [Aeromicrobium duanguangcaii]MCL3837226.1 C40 family peptidase [Aeromicrobium duanguangcaii]